MNGIDGVSFREVPGGLIVNVKKSQKSSTSGKLKKRLPYGFKQISRQISEAKTPDAARLMVAKVQAKLDFLQRKLRSGEYSDYEVTQAILHASSMERIAKRKLHHLEEEQLAENGKERVDDLEKQKEEFEENKDCIKSLEENFSEEELREMEEELKEMEREMEEETMSELQDIISCSGREMSEEEIKELKRKHRSDEEKQLNKADMRYLRALFNQLEQEKRQSGVSSVSSSSDRGFESFDCTMESMPEIEFSDSGGSFDASV